MCQLTRIVRNENGYVAQCIQCKALEIATGTSVICISYAKWSSFLDYIRQAKQMQPAKETHMKSIMLDIAGTDFFQMYLSYEELEAFYHLLDKADDELKARQLIKCFDVAK